MIAHSGHTPFVISFFNALASADRISPPIMQKVASSTLGSIAGGFDLRSWNREAFRDSRTKAITLSQVERSWASILHVTPIDGRELANYIAHCKRFCQDVVVELVVTKLIKDLGKIHLDDFGNMMFPFLRGLFAHFTVQELSSPLHASLFQQTLATYLQRFLGSEPRQPQMWRRNPAACPYQSVRDAITGCHNCKILNAFLEHPHYDRFTFKVAKDEHNHLKSAIYTGKSDGRKESVNIAQNWRLSVVKTSDTFQKDHAAWIKRCAEATKHMRDLGKENMRLFLGTELEKIWFMLEYRLQEAHHRGNAYPMGEFEGSADFLALQHPPSRRPQPSLERQPLNGGAHREPLAHTTVNGRQETGPTYRQPHAPTGDAASMRIEGLERKSAGEVIDLTHDEKRVYR